MAIYEIQTGLDRYSSLVFSALEYLALFGLVLLHEFGHAFANRQTGGTSENILLWPFGGIAFINAPMRPAAHLWGIAAGPLVNLVLVPVLWLVLHYGVPADASDDAWTLVAMVHYLNLALLVFNLLPVFSMDGGQILQALLWFKVGYVKSIHIAAAAGLVGGTALMAYGLLEYGPDLLLILVCLWLLHGAWSAFRTSGRQLAEQAREGAASEAVPVPP